MTSLSLPLSRKQQLTTLRVLTHIGALVPLLWLYYDYYTYNLPAEEIRAAILRTGYPALVLLILSLTCTPLNTVLGWKLVLPLRKPLGLYAFFYATLHLAIFAFIDYGGRITVVWEEIVRRRYALAGFAAFLLLLPLAATSTTWAMRKLGKRWKPLHRWVYIAAALAILHYLWLVKQAYREPLIFAGILIVLLVLRIASIKKWVLRHRRKWLR